VKPETENWIKLADEDRRMAESALNASLYRPCVFHCQQAIEKLLKALWIEQAEAGVPPKTHGLVSLAQEIRLELDDEGSQLLDELTKQYNPTRYGDVMVEYTLKQAEDYQRRTQELYKWLLAKLT